MVMGFVVFEDKIEQFEGVNPVYVDFAHDIGPVFDVLQGEQHVVGDPVHHLVMTHDWQTFEKVGGQRFLMFQVLLVVINQGGQQKDRQLINRRGVCF
jgi:hypothetical protein